MLTILTYSQGYVLKPLGMRISEPDWPPASLTLTRVTLEILSLHGLPRPTESRPCLEGRHARCHQYAPHAPHAPHAPQRRTPRSPRSIRSPEWRRLGVGGVRGWRGVG